MYRGCDREDAHGRDDDRGYGGGHGRENDHHGHEHVHDDDHHHGAPVPGSPGDLFSPDLFLSRIRMCHT